jgi:circadian clock protein KaiB
MALKSPKNEVDMTEDYFFRLFVAGGESNSRLAEQNLRALCNEHLPGRHQIEVVDVLKDAEKALQAKIMLAPAVAVISPRAMTFYGTLNDKPKILAALGFA